MSFVQSSALLLWIAVHHIKLYSATDNSNSFLWLITPWFIDICYVLFSISSFLKRFFLYSWKVFCIQFVLSLNFLSCLSQSKYLLYFFWQLSKISWILFAFFFYSSSHQCLGFKDIFLDFHSASNCHSQCKGKYFNRWHWCLPLMQQRKWQWLRPALCPRKICECTTDQCFTSYYLNLRTCSS